MNMELIEQSVQYTFNNEKYTDGFKKRILKNVRKDAIAEGISKVGDAISGLQGDKLCRSLNSKAWRGACER